MQNFILFGDGGSRGNPGPAALGFVVYEIEIDLRTLPPNFELTSSWLANAKLIHEEGRYIGTNTNNVAEWGALVDGLEYITKNYGFDIHVLAFMDSQLVVRQVQRVYKVKQPHLKPFFEKVATFGRDLAYFNIHHIYREHNKEADRMVNKALDEV